MEALFASGRVVDLILFLMACEAALLALLYSRGRFPIPPQRLLPNLAAGACLLLALRAALAGSGVALCSTWLLLGLGGHVLDLSLRARSAGRR